MQFDSDVELSVKRNPSWNPTGRTSLQCRLYIVNGICLMDAPVDVVNIGALVNHRFISLVIKLQS